MKLGIIIDSVTGWTKKEAENKGWGFVPMFLNINGKEYKDGVDIDNKEFYSTLDINDNVSTACASHAQFVDVYTSMSKKYDEVIFIPISEKLSSQNQIAIQAAKEFKNVHVLKSRWVGYGIITMLEKAVALAKEGVPIQQIIKRLNNAVPKLQGMIMPETMDWLKKGGRISKSTAMLGNLLSIIPIIYFDGGMEKWGKGRSLPKTMIKATKGLLEIVGGNRDDYDYVLLTAHMEDPERTKTDKKLRALLEKQFKIKVMISVFPRILVLHVGIGTYAIMTIPKKI